MGNFTVYPAMDIRHAGVVRLRQGKAQEQTFYSDEPGRIARKWLESGASWLHVVNLDAAFGEESPRNAEAIERIIEACGGKLNIQLGGGIRNQSQIQGALSLGVSRVVLGTAVVQDPGFAEQALERFSPEKIAFALDALHGALQSHGWREDTAITIEALADRLNGVGAKTLIYTDIARDGMQTGVDWDNAKRLAERTGVDVIASGGVSSLEDVAAVRSAGLAGVIVGRALYEENFTLEEALNVR